MESGATGNCTVGDYMTHPAFLSIPSTGFWVGKFETGTTLTGNYNVRNGDAIRIKPNVISWRGIQVANAFYTSYDYKRNLDSHMMKNTEWGVVAYLQYSAYGNKMNVRINNNSSLITGYQANSEPTCGYTSASQECNRYCNDGSCNTSYPNSILASTTGNISGIYDMSGGAWEYVMGVMMDQSGNPMSGRNSIENSRFNGRFGTEEGSFSTGYDWPDSKYYDQYVYTTSSVNYQNRILGDATGEMGPFAMMSSNNSSGSFYNSSSWLKASLSFVTVGYPYYGRGGTYHDGFQVRILSTNPYSGTSVSGWSFRIVLTP